MSDTTPKPAPKNRSAGRPNERAGPADQDQSDGTADAGPLTAPVPEVPTQPLVTVAVIALAGLLTISAFAGPALVAGAIALAAGVLVWGWPGLLGVPSPRGTTFVLAGGAAAAIGTALATSAEPFLRWMPVALAGSVIVAFIHQLARRDGRPRLVESIATNITAIAIVVSGASLVVLPRTPHGSWVVVLTSTAVAVCAVTDLAGASQRLRAWLLPAGMLAGGLASLAVGHLLGTGWWAAAFLGATTAGVGHTVRRVLAILPAISSARSQLVSASASVLTVGVVAYVVGRLFIA